MKNGFDISSNSFVAEKEGTYVVEITAKDSSNNETKEKIYMHTNSKGTGKT